MTTSGKRSPRIHPPHALGRLGEARARDYLVARGWVIEAQNYRFGRREVDIVARKGNLVAFVEVKTRAGDGFGAPEEAVTALKRREIEIVAGWYLRTHHLVDVDVRFDVVSVTVGPHARLEHLEDAWRPERPR
ncbi:MAG: YraN family protein [Gemmatimonadales bacterium]